MHQICIKEDTVATDSYERKTRRTKMIRLFASLSLLFFLLAIGSAFNSQLEGRSCVANQTMGVYKPLKQCPSLYKKWLQTTTAVNVPDEGIWCCPNEATNTRKRSIREAPTPDSYAKAKAKCEEYSRLADTLPISPATTADEQPSLSSADKVKTQPKEFSITATIGYKSPRGTVFVCSGSVISPRFVLTAAHCADDKYFPDVSKYWVRMGDVNLKSTDDNPNAQQIRVIERIRHPSYKRLEKYHDIALFKLEKDINFNQWVRPACLPYSLPDNAASEATAVGRGINSKHGGNPSSEPIKLKVTTKLVSQLECNDNYKDILPAGVIADWQLCARVVETDIRVVSGGPMVIVNNDQPSMYSLIGIASMGKIFGDHTDIYTRVYHYVPWIESIVWPNSE